MMNKTRWVLIADDDDDIREMIATSLRTEEADVSFEVVEARNGIEALEAASRREFDCVVTDLKMPRSGGAQFINSMRNQTLNASTPAVIVSGDGDEFAAQSPHIRLIAKPFSPQEVSRAVMLEMKLGRLDSRAPVHLLTPFCESARLMVKTDLLEPLVPTVKKAGEHLPGEFFTTLVFTTGPTQARINAGFDRSMIEYLKATVLAEKIAPQTPELTARWAAQWLFEHSHAKLAKLMHAEPRLADVVVSNLKTDSTALSELLRTNGIVSTLKTAHGLLSIGAVCRAKTSRV